MMAVRDMLDSKGREVWSISPADSVYRAIEVMEQKGVGALTVVDEGGRLVGIVSERDCARRLVLKHKVASETSISQIMSTDVVSVGEETSVDGCMALMATHRIRHLPVVEHDKLTGIVAVGDVLKFIIREQSSVIDELESYVKDETGGSG